MSDIRLATQIEKLRNVLKEHGFTPKNESSTTRFIESWQRGPLRVALYKHELDDSSVRLYLSNSSALDTDDVVKFLEDLLFKDVLYPPAES